MKLIYVYINAAALQQQHRLVSQLYLIHIRSERGRKVASVPAGS